MGLIVSTFKHLPVLPEDPILGLADTYARDIRNNKIDLGIGIYKNSDGHTPILESVQAAEYWLLENQSSKAYIGSEGLPAFNHAMQIGGDAAFKLMVPLLAGYIAYSIADRKSVV